MTEPSELPAEEEPIRLRDPFIAGLLAWLIPGLGHLYQGRRAKAALYFFAIVGLFVWGLYLGSNSQVGWGRVVYCSFRDNDWRLQYIGQLGVGLPALPALVQADRVKGGKPPLWNGFMAPPRLDRHGEGDATRSDLDLSLTRYFDLGTQFTLIAGLLNILVIYDACCGPVILPQRRKDEEDTPDKAEDDSEKNS